MREIFLTSSALILIISVLRFFLRGKIAPRLQYTLWLFVAARLLIPGTLFTTPVALIGASGGLSDTVQAVFPDIPSLPQNETPGVTLPAGAVPPPAADPPPDWPDVIWKAGIAVTGGVMLLSNLYFAASLHRKRRRLTLPPSVETGRLPVYLVEDLPSPCLFGLFQPAIYVNCPSLAPERLPFILAHERTHFRHADHLWAVLRAVCLTVHWYNPLVWLAASLSRRDCELACDDGVIWLLGEHQRLDYGGILLQMVSSGNPSLLRASTSMSAGKRNLKERVIMISQRPRMLKATLTAVVLVMCAAVAVTFGGAERAVPSGGNAENKIFPMTSGRLTSTEYTHFSGLFSLTVPDNWLEDVTYVESEDGTAFYEADTNCWLMTIIPEPVEWVEVYNQTGVRLAEFEFNGDAESNGSPYFYMLDWNQEPEYTAENRSHIFSLLEQRKALAWNFRLLASADIFSQLVHTLYPTNLPLAITYLPYLSWENYTALYGEDETLALLSAVQQFAESGETDWGQYHDIMSSHMSAGPYADAYAAMIWSLYQNNPKNFSTVLDSIYLTEHERAYMLYWFRTALAAEQDRPDLLHTSDQEIYQLLLNGVPS